MRFDVSHWMLNDMLKVNFNMVKTFHKNGPIDAAGMGIYRQAIMRNPTEPIWNEDGTFYENFAVNYYYNPVGIIREQDGKYNSENTRMTGNITFEPIKNWQTNLMLSRRVTSDHNRGYYTSEYFHRRARITQDMLIILRMNIPQIIWKLLLNIIILGINIVLMHWWAIITSIM